MSVWLKQKLHETAFLLSYTYSFGTLHSKITVQRLGGRVRLKLTVPVTLSSGRRP